MAPSRIAAARSSMRASRPSAVSSAPSRWSSSSVSRAIWTRARSAESGFWRSWESTLVKPSKRSLWRSSFRSRRFWSVTSVMEPLEFGVQGTDVDGATPLPDPPGLAIGGDDPVGHLEGLAVGDRLPNGPPDPIALLRVDDVAPREVAGQDPLARIARQRLAVLLQGRHRLVGVVRTAVDRPGEVVDQRPEAVVAVGGVGQVSQDGLADRPPMAGRRGAGDRRPLGIPVGGDVGKFGRRGRLVALQVVSRSAISEWSSGWMNSRASRPTSAAGSLALREVGARAVRVDDGAVLVVAQHRRRGRVDEFAGVALVAPQGGLGAALGDRLGDPVCEDRVRSVPVSFRR
jgi:hypothetical protein